MSQGFLYLRSMCLIYRGQPHTASLYGTTQHEHTNQNVLAHSKILLNSYRFSIREVLNENENVNYRKKKSHRRIKYTKHMSRNKKKTFFMERISSIALTWQCIGLVGRSIGWAVRVSIP